MMNKNSFFLLLFSIIDTEEKKKLEDEITKLKKYIDHLHTKLNGYREIIGRSNTDYSSESDCDSDND